MANVDDDNSSNEFTLTVTTTNSILQKPKLNLSSGGLKVSMLRPSAFSLNSTVTTDSDKTSPTSTSSSLTTNTLSGIPECSSSFSNPFVKTSNDDNKEGECNNKDKKDDTSKLDNKSDPLSLLSNNGLPKSNLFSVAKTTPISSNTGFVFGQNVHERVTGGTVSNTDASDSTKGEKDNLNNSSDVSGSSSSGLLFASAFVQKTGGDNQENSTPKETSSKSLTEAAREYEESRAQKRKFEEVETFTGEENETNVLDINCKLFTFASSTWEERGRGSLRLNDPKSNNSNSRVVFRASGSLRVLLNTKIWNGMIAERPSQKSLRLTAIDNSGQIKVYLVMARPNDINCLYSALKKRIEEAQQKVTIVDDDDVELINNETDNNEEDDVKQEQESCSTIIITEEKSTDSQKTSDADQTDEPSPKKIILEDVKTS